MKKTKLTRSHLAKEISNVTGFSRLYSKKLTEDLIAVLVNLIEKDNFSLKNFGTFKLINKKERVGRNPKTLEQFKITARKSISFLPSNKLIKSLNKYT